ncbi:MAG: FAD-dependent oxidoreductase [Epulopiscium sp.]|nr:FAD-dependent oxidoreductase [Candidatus Epulonipiscium sp.]
MNALELKKGLYWTGVLDKNLRVFDIVMETQFGTTYNSYVLQGSEKTVLFETSKLKFFDEYIKTLEQIVDVKEIDYIVMNHTEPDHAGSIEKLIQINPALRIVGTPTALEFLKNLINRDFYSVAVEDGDTLSLGDKTLHFMILPNLHWPDTMYTYLEEDKVLFPCDSFGSHYSHEDILLSKVTNNEDYLSALKYYYDNIIGPFKPFMLDALKRIENLEIDMICCGHGPVVDCRVEELKTYYKQWSTVVNPNPRKTVIIPYVSAYGYTKELADAITEGIKHSGDIDVRSYDMIEADTAKVLEELLYADGILFGTPTIVGEALKPIWDLTTSIFAGTHGGKYASAFGSYAWSGEGVPHIIERLHQLQMKVVDGFQIKLKPGKKDLAGAYEYGYNFGCYIQEKPPKLKTSKKALVKCLVCGEIFPEGTEICPVCGVGPSNFVPVEVEEINFFQDTDETYLVLGNGIAGLNAAKAIRARNKTCSITMISEEEALTYNRPMLTKSMLAKYEVEQLLVERKSWYEEQNIKTILGKKISMLDTKAKTVTLEDGITLSYDKCIYALGAECFIPPIPGADKKGVVSIRRITDTNAIRKVLPQTKNIVVIGGGVLGLEAAWELSKSKANVTVLELAPTLMGRQLDSRASDLLQEAIAQADIQLKLGVQIASIEGDDAVTSVKLASGEEIMADLVVISSGVRANVSLAEKAGIEVDRAVVVNDRMETSAKDVYACGDCAVYHGTNYAIWPEALEMGRIAGANAVGDSLEYENILAAVSYHGMNTSLYSIGDNGKKASEKYKSVEFMDDHKNTYEKYYFLNNRLVGAILMGDTTKIGKVTEAIAKPAQFKDMFQQ